MAKITSMNAEEIRDFIVKHLPNRSDEKDKFGEVFTPDYLVEELFENLPNEVWYNPNLKWLDPAAGVGNFGLLAYLKLMKTLENSIPDSNERSNHILTNMLYHIELNSENAKKLKELFGKSNVFSGSFLNTNCEDVNQSILKVFGISQFDVIMGNPPYQRSMTKSEKKGTNAGRQTLWDKFITAAFNLLKTGGYLLFITPNSWRGLGKLAHLWQFMKSKKILFLHIYGMRDGIRHFGASTRFDLFIVQNSVNNGRHKSNIIDELGNKSKMLLAEWPFLPNYMYKEIASILTSEGRGIDVLYDTFYHTQRTNTMRANKTREFKYPVVHNITREGLGFWYSNKKRSDNLSVPKVLLNFNQFQYPYNDYKNAYGMSQLTFGIPIKNKRHGDLLVAAINSQEFKEIIKATKWAVFQTDWRMFKYFKSDFYKKYLGSNSKKHTMKAKTRIINISKKKRNLK